MANEVWDELYNRLAELIQAHRTTLIFVNNRRLAERATRFLAECIGAEHVACHHGSLSKEHRLNAETRLKEGSLKALIATSSLELGIDIGDIDLVCQMGSPRLISALAPARRPRGACDRRDPEGAAVPALARRPRRVHRPPRRRAARRARQDPRAGEAARRALAADRRRSRLPRMGRGRVAGRVSPRAALCRPHCGGIRAGPADARRGLLDPARPALGLPALRHGQPAAAPAAKARGSRP